MATLYHQISLYRKGVTYRRSKEFVNIFRESIVYPLVDMKEKDTGIFLLNNTHFLEILNYVQYSAVLHKVLTKYSHHGWTMLLTCIHVFIYLFLNIMLLFIFHLILLFCVVLLHSYFCILSATKMMYSINLIIQNWKNGKYPQQKIFSCLNLTQLRIGYKVLGGIRYFWAVSHKNDVFNESYNQQWEK